VIDGEERDAIRAASKAARERSAELYEDLVRAQLEAREVMAETGRVIRRTGLRLDR
jgi:hypothetical protein